MIMHHLRIALSLSLAATVSTLAACSSPPGTADDEGLLVAAASSLTMPFELAGQAFQALSGTSVIISFGSTGQLAQQIRNGAPFDLFAAADARHIDQLIAEGLLLPETRTAFARGRLVLLVDARQAADVQSLQDLASLQGARIALANPAHAPYGLAARQALQEAGVWQSLQPNLVFAETVRQAAQMVASGNAAAGLVAAPTVVEQEGLHAYPIPHTAYAPILHVAAVVVSSPHREQAGRFLEFLSSSEGQALLNRWGLDPAEAESE